MKVKISHDFNIDAETFWSKCFLDPEFNRVLYKEALKFPEWEITEEKTQGDLLIRKVRVTPKQDAPATITKLLGDKFSYMEEGTYDRAAQKYSFRVVPATLGDKIRTDGVMRTESLGDKKIRRIVDINIEVKIFGVGGLVEGFVSKSTQDSYAQAAAFTNKWIAEKKL